MGQFYKDYLKAISEVKDQAASQIKSKFGSLFDSLESRVRDDGGSVSGLLIISNNLTIYVVVGFTPLGTDPLIHCFCRFGEVLSDMGRKPVRTWEKMIDVDEFGPQHLVDMFTDATKAAVKYIERA